MEKIRNIRSFVERTQIAIGTIFISVFLLTVLLQIVSRLLKISMTWSEDVAVYSFIWAVLMGASWAVGRNEHFAFTSLGDKLRGKSKLIYNIVIYSITMIFTIAIIKYGIDVTLKFWNYRWPNLSSMKMGYVWMSMPVTGVSMTFYLVMHIIEDLLELKKGGNN